MSEYERLQNPKVGRGRRNGSEEADHGWADFSRVRATSNVFKVLRSAQYQWPTQKEGRGSTGFGVGYENSRHWTLDHRAMIPLKNSRVRPLSSVVDMMRSSCDGLPPGEACSLSTRPKSVGGKD
ncbi:hypothetical protein TNCV_4660061 [Trichonephila clavipes]|uniref:Uncharacterized protein n=1 Tax=Trichonephila clavipes TaxID=2585209 RepID=A0A8X6VIA8_TRICX|nr:hypothetical protein TNCV_4660061 [Trichonephila clavipes]